MKSISKLEGVILIWQRTLLIWCYLTKVWPCFLSLYKCRRWLNVVLDQNLNKLQSIFFQSLQKHYTFSLNPFQTSDVQIYIFFFFSKRLRLAAFENAHFRNRLYCNACISFLFLPTDLCWSVLCLPYNFVSPPMGYLKKKEKWAKQPFSTHLWPHNDPVSIRKSRNQQDKKMPKGLIRN